MKKSIYPELLEKRHLMASLSCTADDVPFVGTCTLPSFTIPAATPETVTFFKLGGGSVSYDSTHNFYQRMNDPALELYGNGDLGFGYRTVAQGFDLTVLTGDSTAAMPSYAVLAQCSINAHSGYEGGGFGTICKTMPEDQYLANFSGQPVQFPIVSVVSTDETTGLLYFGPGTTITPDAHLTITGNLRLDTTMHHDSFGCLATNAIEIAFTGLTVTDADTGATLLSNTGMGLTSMVVVESATSGPVGIWNSNVNPNFCPDGARQGFINTADA